LAPEQFGVNLREFLQLLLQGAEVFGPLACGLLLRFTLQEELVHLPHRQALGQIIEWTMLGSAIMTMAPRFATGGKTLHHRSAQEIGRNAQLLEEKALALAQSQRGLAGVVEYPRHVYGEDKKTPSAVNKKENAAKMRKCSTP
jgi:hypothetical protein